MDLPRHILERVQRLYAYHQRSKILAMGIKAFPPGMPDYRPSAPRVFGERPKAALPTALLDAPIGLLTLLNAGQDVLPDSLRSPPQDLRTLASWLYFAAGESKRVVERAPVHVRAFAEGDAIFPFEIYVGVFAVKGIDPGFYHFSPREFALRKLREGAAALMQIKKGRPDLEFLKTLPAVFLVSAHYWRSIWRYGRRGYRTMLVDAGQAVQNLVTAGAGLGAQTVTRLRMNDYTMRELIGVKLDEPLETAESVLAMVAWADRAPQPIDLSRDANGGVPNGPPPAAHPAEEPTGEAVPGEPQPPGMGTIHREPLSSRIIEDDMTLEPLFAHRDCVDPGVAVRELRPPLTELSPVPANFPAKTNVSMDFEPEGGPSVRQVLLDRHPRAQLTKQPISRANLLSINKVAFRGGSCFPMFPSGPHVACARPFWIINDVIGMEQGIWFYNPMADSWHLLRAGRFRREAKYVAGDRAEFGDAAATCVMMANLYQLMNQGGPDVYRLAHLEAGIVAQRTHLAASALGLGAGISQEFYDEDARLFLGLAKTGWEPLCVMAVGGRTKPVASARA
jgi:SagB-type dehydrogenase family enzyme